MDAYRVGVGEPIFVLTRAVDRFLQLRLGEVVRATVVDVSPEGDVSLRIKGNLIQAKTTLQLPMDASVLCRVLGEQAGEGGPEIRLQFLEMMANPEIAASQNASANVVQSLAQELAANLPVAGQVPKDLASTLEQLLKALPEDSAALPKEIRDQLQSLLQTSLRNTGQSIQNRVSLLINEPVLKEFAELLDLAGVKERLFTDMEKALQAPLKSNLENTGVAMEARLRALVQSLPAEGEVVGKEPMSTSVVVQSSDIDHLQTDLKVRLLQMKQMIVDYDQQLAANTLPLQAAGTKQVGEKRAALGRMLQGVDGLLQDIETFQLLSKLTDSFYTFLPVVWKGLKEADIAFKRSRSGPEGKSYYCLMNLDFESHGKLTVVAMMQGRDFFVSFKTDNPEFRATLDSNVQELQQMFQHQGLNLKLANVLGLEENHLMPFERLESFENIINIRI
jgi:hypothetical protein